MARSDGADGGGAAPLHVLRVRRAAIWRVARMVARCRLRAIAAAGAAAGGCGRQRAARRGAAAARF